MKPIQLAIVTSTIAATCLLASCGKKEETAATPAATAASTAADTTPPSEALLQVLTAAPLGPAGEIHKVRTTVKPGDEITIGGRIMGNAKPFVDGRAAFTLGDPSVLTACNDTPGDNCETPWDNCCDSKEDKLVGLATIQILGPDGRVLKEALEGKGGLAKLGKVTVSGKVAEGSSADSLVVNATAIKVDP